MDSNMVDIVKYKQWTSTDRSTMETIIQPVDEFLQSFMKALNTASASNLGHHLGAFKKIKGPLVMQS